MRHRGVPYRSQWAGLGCNAAVVGGADPCTTGPWWETGFADPDEYRFWSHRLCGLACLESALRYWAVPHPDRAALVADACAWGAYVRHADGRVDGLRYAPFVNWVTARFGLSGQVHRTIGLAELAGTVSGDSVAIASVSPEIRWPERANECRGGHLVLITGAEDGRVWFHNPSGLPATAVDAELPAADMERFFAGRGITLSRARLAG
jgi:hypothetical protein